MSSTSHGMIILAPTDSASGFTRLAERVALIGEGQFRAVRRQRLGDTPSDRVVIGDAHDQAALALHQLGHGQLYASSRLNTTDALVPPKPNEFDSTQPSLALSTRSRTIGMPAMSGSRFSMLALSQMKPLFIISSE